MRLTIIVPDNAVGIDGLFYQVNLDGLVPQNLHALQWYGDRGEEEYIDENGTPTNVPIESLDAYQAAIQAWQNAHDAATAPPPQPSLKEAKARRIAEIKGYAYALLAPTDWYVIRQHETGDPIPHHVSDYRAAVRAASDAAEADIIGLEDVSEVLKFVVNWPDFQNTESPDL